MIMCFVSQAGAAKAAAKLDKETRLERRTINQPDRSVDYGWAVAVRDTDGWKLMEEGK